MLFGRPVGCTQQAKTRVRSTNNKNCSLFCCTRQTRFGVCSSLQGETKKVGSRTTTKRCSCVILRKKKEKGVAGERPMYLTAISHERCGPPVPRRTSALHQRLASLNRNPGCKQRAVGAPPVFRASTTGRVPPACPLPPPPLLLSPSPFPPQATVVGRSSLQRVVYRQLKSLQDD